MITETDRRHAPNADTVEAIESGVVNTGDYPSTLDDVDAILASTAPLAKRHDALLDLRDQAEAAWPGGSGGDMAALLRVIDAALLRLERAARHPGGRAASGLDPTGRADALSPDMLLGDDGGLDPDPTHRS